MNKSLVSIIIPAYNAGKYILEAVDSALNQDYLNKEIIVVNDGSTDNTEEILRSYIDAGKIVYVFQENGGLSAARNAAIKIAKGKYIAFLDADDIFLPYKLRDQVEFLENNFDCDVSYCDVYHFWDHDYNILYKLNYDYPSGGKELITKFIERFFIVPVSVVLRKSVFENFGYFDENLRRAEDLDFWLRVVSGGGKICFMPKILAKVRMLKEGNLQSLESQPRVKFIELQVLERFYFNLNKEDKIKYREEYFLERHRKKLGVTYLMNGDFLNAKKYINSWWVIFLKIMPLEFSKLFLSKIYYFRRNSLLRRV